VGVRYLHSDTLAPPRALLSTVHSGLVTVTRSGAQSHRHVMHEGGVLLDEGGVYCG